MANNTRTVRTPVIRLSYAHLVEPKQYKENGVAKGAPTFNTEMIVDPDSMKGSFEVRDESGEWKKIEDFTAFLMDFAKSEWGSDFDINGAVKHGGMKWPIQDGNKIIEKKETKSGKKATRMEQYVDQRVLRSKSSEKSPPRLYMRGPDNIVLLDRDVEKDLKQARKFFNSGNYAVLSLNLVPNEVDERKYLTFYINDVLYHSKGERLGGVDGATVFSGYEGGESETDPSQGLDQRDASGDLSDEIPF